MQGFTNLKDWGFHYFEFSSKFQKKYVRFSYMALISIKSLILIKAILFYSETSLQRTPSGPQKSVRYRDVSAT